MNHFTVQSRSFHYIRIPLQPSFLPQNEAPCTLGGVSPFPPLSAPGTVNRLSDPMHLAVEDIIYERIIPYVTFGAGLSFSRFIHDTVCLSTLCMFVAKYPIVCKHPTCLSTLQLMGVWVGSSSWDYEWQHY